MPRAAGGYDPVRRSHIPPRTSPWGCRDKATTHLSSYLLARRREPEDAVS